MGRAPCCEKVGLKQGRWTAEEDRTLMKYISDHGEGSWRALPKNAGLLRCGKSCRLRWINYLRADLKRGNISQEEEETIIKLHASFGNRWSQIAGHLPGRTDNEIKNYWNSHLIKKVQSSHSAPMAADPNKIDDRGKRKGGGPSSSSKKKKKKKNNNSHERTGTEEHMERAKSEDGGGPGGKVVVSSDSDPHQTTSTVTFDGPDEWVKQTGAVGPDVGLGCGVISPRIVLDSGFWGALDEVEGGGPAAGASEDSGAISSREERKSGAMSSAEGKESGAPVLNEEGGEGGPTKEVRVVGLNEESGLGNLMDWELEGMEAQPWDGGEREIWSWLWESQGGELDFQLVDGGGHQVECFSSWLLCDDT